MKCSTSLLGEDARYTPTPVQGGLIERPEEVLHPGALASRPESGDVVGAP